MRRKFDKLARTEHGTIRFIEENVEDHIDAYWGSRTEAVIPKVHEKVPFSELYRRTGCQFQPFNSIYQLYADKVAGRLDGARVF